MKEKNSHFAWFSNQGSDHGNDFLGAFKSEDELFESVVTPGNYD